MVDPWRDVRALVWRTRPPQPWTLASHGTMFDTIDVTWLESPDSCNFPAPTQMAHRLQIPELCGVALSIDQPICQTLCILWRLAARVINIANMCVKLQMRTYVCQALCPFWVHFGSILWVHSLGPWLRSILECILRSILGPFCGPSVGSNSATQLGG